VCTGRIRGGPLNPRDLPSPNHSIAPCPTGVLRETQLKGVEAKVDPLSSTPFGFGRRPASHAQWNLTAFAQGSVQGAGRLVASWSVPSTPFDFAAESAGTAAARRAAPLRARFAGCAGGARRGESGGMAIAGNRPPAHGAGRGLNEVGHPLYAGGPNEAGRPAVPCAAWVLNLLSQVGTGRRASPWPQPTASSV